MDLREWLENKIRENSWDYRLNEDSPYEDNAISIAKPILKRAKNGKIAVDKKRTKQFQDFAKNYNGNGYGSIRSDRMFTNDEPISNTYDLNKFAFPGDDWDFYNDLEAKYPGITRDIIIEGDGYSERPYYSWEEDAWKTQQLYNDTKFDPNGKIEDYYSLSFEPEDGFSINELPYEEKNLPSNIKNYNKATKYLKSNGETKLGAQFTIQELLDYFESQKPEAIKKYKQGLEQKKLDDIASDFE